MKTKYINHLASILFLILLSCHSQEKLSLAIQKEGPAPTAKNIILLIGDGMSISQVTAGLYSNNNYLNLEKCKYVGLHKSYSADNLVTDSGAGATAISIGKKTYNGAIGVDADTLSHPTLLEEAEEKAYASGLIATSSITHATPAAFIAHVKSRNMHEEIALQFLQTEIDYFVGGGYKYFGDRTDGKDLIKQLRDKNYLVNDYRSTKLEDVNCDPEKNFAYLSAKNSPKKQMEGRDYLPVAMAKALNFLPQKSEKGFFLMLESSQIDWGGHDNDQEYIISEMLEFDQVIGQALDFASKDKETLVIITGDHETGGMAINEGSSLNALSTSYTSGGHTADLIPVFAYGPGAEIFAGIYENTALYSKMRKAFGWTSEE